MSAAELWYSLPLIVSVSLVYAATRYEPMEFIISHAVRTGVWLMGFMVIVTLILWGLSAWMT